MAPTVTPISVISRKSYGVLTRLMPSQTRSASTSRPPAIGITSGRYPRVRIKGWRRASVANWSSVGELGGGGLLLPQPQWCPLGDLHEARRRGDRLERGRLAALEQLVLRDRVRGRVAVLVDREVAEDPVRHLRVEQAVGGLRPAAARFGDRVQHDLHRLGAVCRVRVRLGPDLGAEVLHELLALRAELVVRLAGDADVHAERRATRVLPRVAERAEAVRRDEREALAEGPAQVLDQLAAVLALEAAEVDDVGARLLHLVRERLVARRLRIPGGEAGDLQAELLRRVPEVRRDAEAVGLLVVEDEDALVAELLREHRVRRALVVVGRDDPDVVPLAVRVVLVRLTGRRAGAAVREPDVGVGGAHHPYRPVGGAVQDRDDDLGASGVERPDDADHLLVVRVGVAVRRALAGVPLAGLRRRVVTRLVADVVAARLEVVLLEDELDRLRHLDRLRPARSLQREVGRDEVVGARAALVDALTGRGGKRGPIAAASASGVRIAFAALLASAAGRDEREHRSRHDEQPQDWAFSHNLLLRPATMTRRRHCAVAVSIDASAGARKP